MTIQTKLLILIGSMLLLSFLTLSYFNYQQATENARQDLYDQADKIRNLLMAYLYTGQKVFIDHKLPVTEKTHGLLPASAVGEMSKIYSRWDKSGFSFNNVSDQPRNPENQADALELEIMDYFRKNDDKKTVFQSFTNNSGEKYYLYARPIWIKKACLKCHDTRENAPKTIRERYDTAYGYKIGDLRGLLSIKLPAKTIEIRAWDTFIQNAKFQLITIIIIFLMVIVFIRQSIIRPLNLLSSAMSNVSQGNYSKRVDSLTGEFDTMQESFNYMGQELEKNQQELENRVEKRTLELRQSNHELSTALSNLKTTQNQLIEKQKMAELGGLVAGVAHEINTPIGVGVTAASHLDVIVEKFRHKFENEGLTKSELEKYLQNTQESSAIILQNLDRAAELIRSFKQIAVDQSQDNHRCINVKEYVEGILFTLKPILTKTLHKIELITDDDIKIFCNPGQFSQVISNLFINAIKHAYNERDAGILSLEIKLVPKKVTFHFSDNGKGIPEHELTHIFTPFFTTARQNGGSGLGLSTVYNIITQNMNGTIRCESTEGQGTHFYFDIPIDDKSNNTD
ncbi:MAG: DUF3365 domain-containing protein [Gammaproteobacteria bacterium]|nr:DUF3365 domain-containing protein [Gammaproteobacteria bacterium]